MSSEATTANPRTVGEKDGPGPRSAAPAPAPGSKTRVPRAGRRLIEEWLPIEKIGLEALRERTPMTPLPGAQPAARVVGPAAAGGLAGGGAGVAFAR